MERYLGYYRDGRKPRHAGLLIRSFVQCREDVWAVEVELQAKRRLEIAWAEPSDDPRDGQRRGGKP
jgi:hypothetical protein